MILPLSRRLLALFPSILAIPATVLLLQQADAHAPAAPAPTLQPSAGAGHFSGAAFVSSTVPTVADDIDPGALLAQGQTLLDMGEYSQAMEKFRKILTETPTASQAAEARFGLGVAEYYTADYAGAVQAFTEFRTAYPGHAKAALAQFWLAESLRDAGRDAEALQAYQSFIAVSPLVADHAHWRRAQLLIKSHDYRSALQEIHAAQAVGPSPTLARTLRRNEADVLLAAGQPQQALVIYKALQDAGDGDQAELLYMSAQARRAAGDADGYRGVLVQLVQQEPSSYYAKLALDVVGGSPAITPYQEGQVRYYQRDNDAALAAFERQRRDFPSSADTPWAAYRIALLDERLDRNDEALGELSAITRMYPAHQAAQDALWEEALLLTQLGRTAEATAAFNEFAVRFPGTERASEALFRQGLTAYQSGDLRGALRIWGGLPPEPAGSRVAGRAAFWQAKAARALGDGAASTRASASAEQVRPGRYYALEARALQQPPAPPGRPSYGPLDTVISPEEDAAVDRWLSSWAVWQPSPERDAAARMLERGAMLSSMGMRMSAAGEYRDALQTAGKDAYALYAMGRRLYESGQYQLAMVAANAIFQIAPTRSPEDLPRGLLKMLYPAPYDTQVMQASRAAGIDPLLLYALMRQESRFDRLATSSAGARGLTQVMPATGAEIASDLGISNFDPQDLYRPQIAIQFGAYYLATQLRHLGQESFALAGYNGGAGNALRWMNNDHQMDPDLFLERIDFGETANYVRIVEENYRYYRLLYGGR